MKSFQAGYFSLQNLCGAAYGDIIPPSNAARTLATAEATISMFYITVLIERLAGVYSLRYYTVAPAVFPCEDGDGQEVLTLAVREF
jgi:hypothetical protein